MSDPVLLVAAIVGFLLGNGFFSGSEIAVLTARRSRIDTLVSEGNRGARRVKQLQDQPETFLATVQIGVTLMGTLAGVLGGYLASEHLEPWLSRVLPVRWVAPAVMSALAVGAGIVYVELILGELVPKALALRFAESVAVLVAWPLHLLARVSRAPIALLTASTRAVLLLFGVRKAGGRTFVSEEEIKHLVAEGRSQGVLGDAEAELIHSVFEFSETPVKKVMVPRPKIVGLDVDTASQQVSGLLVESGFSRLPAFEGSVDNVVGLVYVKDILRLLDKRQPVVLRRILHPVHFVPETKKVGPLLKELQRRRTHMAIVIDEHGSVTGLVTMEDLLEEIVGEIQDEYDWEERPVERLRDGSLVVDGTLTAAEMRDTYGVPIPESPEFETVAGYMLDRLGSVPRGGEVVSAGDFRLSVVDVEKNRIARVKVERSTALPPA